MQGREAWAGTPGQPSAPLPGLIPRTLSGPSPHPPRLQFNNWGVGVLFAQGDPRPPGQFQSLSEESVPSAV